MNAILRLAFTYFTATTWLRCATALGLASILYGLINPAIFVGAYFLQACAFAGVALFFLGSSLMPSMFGRMARGRLICMLPFGHLKLLASALLTTMVVALPMPLLIALLLTTAHPNGGGLLVFLSSPFFWQMYLLVFLLCSWLYVLLWVVAKYRNSVPSIRVWLISILVAFLPVKYSSLNADTHWAVLLAWSVASWMLFALYLFLNRRLAAACEAFFSDAPRKFSFYTSQSKVDGISHILGTAHPWIFQYAMMGACVIWFGIVRNSIVWLFFLVFCGALSGAYTCNAGTRSRSLWLRRPGDRAQLFRECEVHFWRRSSLARIVTLLATLVGISIYTHRSIAFIAIAAVLLISGTAASTYLGMMITRGLGWLETMLAIGTVLLLMMATLYATEHAPDIPLMIALELLLVAMALLYRQIAKQHWTRIDWMQCRAVKIS